MLQISADDLLHGPILTHLRKGVRQLLRKTAVIVDGKAAPIPVISSGSSRIRKSAP